MTNTIPTETSRWTGSGPTDYDTPTKRAEGAILLNPTFENKDAQNFWNYVNDFWAIFRYKGQYILTDEAWDLTAEDSPNGIRTIKFFFRHPCRDRKFFSGFLGRFALRPKARSL